MKQKHFQFQWPQKGRRLSTNGDGTNDKLGKRRREKKNDNNNNNNATPLPRHRGTH